MAGGGEPDPDEGPVGDREPGPDEDPDGDGDFAPEEDLAGDGESLRPPLLMEVEGGADVNVDGLKNTDADGSWMMDGPIRSLCADGDPRSVGVGPGVVAVPAAGAEPLPLVSSPQAAARQVSQVLGQWRDS